MFFSLSSDFLLMTFDSLCSATATLLMRQFSDTPVVQRSIASKFDKIFVNKQQHRKKSEYNFSPRETQTVLVCARNKDESKASAGTQTSDLWFENKQFLRDEAKAKP